MVQLLSALVQTSASMAYCVIRAAPGFFPVVLRLEPWGLLYARQAHYQLSTSSALALNP